MTYILANTVFSAQEYITCGTASAAANRAVQPPRGRLEREVGCQIAQLPGLDGSCSSYLAWGDLVQPRRQQVDSKAHSYHEPVLEPPGYNPGELSERTAYTSVHSRATGLAILQGAAHVVEARSHRVS